MIEESKRIKKFRREIIDVIPKFPNNKETKSALESMPLSTLLIHYLNWMTRFVSVKPRRVAIEPAVTGDSHWKILKPQIYALLDKVRSGKDLTPNLSLLVQSKGYTPAASQKGVDVDRWADKDFLLNAMGYHHFHLGMELEEKGHVKRTDDVLFAKVTRDTFSVVGIFDHSVFESSSDEMTTERTRLWKIFNTHSTLGVPPGSVVIPSAIATSGHPLHVVRAAQEFSRTIFEVDPKLDDRNFLQSLYGDKGSEHQTNSKLEWSFYFSTLGLHDKKMNHFFMVRPGFN